MRQSRGEGQIPEALDALSNMLGDGGRLVGFMSPNYELDLLRTSSQDIVSKLKATGTDVDQPFTQQRLKHEHYRRVTQLMFWEDTQRHADAKPYLEHPTSKKLSPILKVICDRRHGNGVVVWLTNRDSLIADKHSVMYVSDEPDVSGKTIEEVMNRYGKE